MLSKNCKTCDNEFDVKDSRDDAKFCSRKCYHKGQREGKTSHPERLVEYVELECTGCGKEIEKPPSRANRSDRQFCDQDCYLEWSKDHQKDQVGRRKRMREREDMCCEICDYSRYVEMSHIIPSSNGGTYHRNNILFLCPNHHRLHDQNMLSLSEIEIVREKINKAILDGDGWKDPNVSPK